MNLNTGITTLYSLLTLCISLCLCTYCPDTRLMSPCACIDGEFYCGGHEHIDLPALFKSLHEHLDDKQRHFSRFHLNNTAIDELKDMTFSDITFDEIYVLNAWNLTKVNVNAFTGTDRITRKISISGNLQLDDNTLFDVLSKFVNVEYIYLGNNNIREIPALAFRPLNGQQSRLKYIRIEGSTISSLGDNAFKHLPSLQELHLYHTSVSHIQEYSFAFVNETNDLFYLYLTMNVNMTSASFAPGSLTHMQRPTLMDVSIPSDVQVLIPTQITYLDESIFGPFLGLNDRNELNMRYNDFDCNDCRNQWIAKYNNTDKRIVWLECSNGKAVTDETNFSNCTQH